ncbi:MAG: diaminopimelate epimerase [Saprospiraceae bacterium]|nr:diaminopimelate epimerase [Saprospiraceae bacterium]
MKRIIPFEKYEASGNDFVLFDFFEKEWFDLKDHALVYKLCQNHFGIGADGLLVLRPHEAYDFEMVYYNADGNLSSFCGNGSRASIAYMANKQNKSELSFIAMDGAHQGLVNEDTVSVRMKDIDGFEKHEFGIFIDSGSPHLIIEVQDPFHCDIDNEGRRLRKLYDPQGVNVNFVQWGPDKITMATYERGVEAETLACGTGVTAAAYYASVLDNSNGFKLKKIETKGGKLELSLELNGLQASNIWLTGPATKVFSGFYYL